MSCIMAAPSVGRAFVAEAPGAYPIPLTPNHHPPLTAQEAHATLRRALRARSAAETSAFFWFAEIAERALYRELGYSSMQAYGHDKLGLSVNLINRYLHLIAALERLPKIRAALRAGTLGWTKAREIIKVASPGNEERWLEAARRLSRRTLEEKVAAAKRRAEAQRRRDPRQPLLDAVPAAQPEAPSPEPAAQAEAPSPKPAAAPSIFIPPAEDDAPKAEAPMRIVLELDPLRFARQQAQIEYIRKSRVLPQQASREDIYDRALGLLADFCREGGGASEIVPRGTGGSPFTVHIYKDGPDGPAFVQTSRGMRAISPEQLERVACDAVIVEPGKRNRAVIPPSLRQRVVDRVQGCCEAPGCSNTQFLEIHHLVPRSRGGTNDPENLAVLCSRCHELWHTKKLDPKIILRSRRRKQGGE